VLGSGAREKHKLWLNATRLLAGGIKIESPTAVSERLGRPEMAY